MRNLFVIQRYSRSKKVTSRGPCLTKKVTSLISISLCLYDVRKCTLLISAIKNSTSQQCYCINLVRLILTSEVRCWNMHSIFFFYYSLDPHLYARKDSVFCLQRNSSHTQPFFSQDSYRQIVQNKMITETLTYNFVQTKIIFETLCPLSALVLFNRESNKSRP